MPIRLGILAALLCLTSPVMAGDENLPDPEANIQTQAAQTWREHRLAHGKEVYEHACAACHDTGVDGAPKIGDRQAWSERSPLWSAVLFEHSREGYLKMPPKGSHEELSDQDVDAAGEYMLSVTFPEKPLD